MEPPWQKTILFNHRAHRENRTELKEILFKKKLSALEPPWQKTILFEAGTPSRGGLPIQYWDLL